MNRPDSATDLKVEIKGVWLPPYSRSTCKSWTKGESQEGSTDYERNSVKVYRTHEKILIF